MNNYPKVSFVTSVYNCEEYISQTIESVIAQTYKNWEYIIIDDNSSDSSANIIESFNDDRIHFFRNDRNKGQVKNLNFGISQATGKYIARLDHDDICYSNRIECQVQYMEENEEVVLCGAKMNCIENGVIFDVKDWLTISDFSEQKFALSYDLDQIAHSSFFIRKSVLEENEIQYRDFLYAEDYALLLDMISVGKVFCIDECLVCYRIFSEQCSQIYSDDLKQSEIVEIQKEYFSHCGYDNWARLTYYIENPLVSMVHFAEYNRLYRNYANWCGLTNSDMRNANGAYIKIYIQQLFSMKKTVAWWFNFAFNSIIPCHEKVKLIMRKMSSLL